MHTTCLLLPLLSFPLSPCLVSPCLLSPCLLSHSLPLSLSLSKAHTGSGSVAIENREWIWSYLVMLSGLDGLQRADPVLHLFPVLRTQNQPATRSDDLHRERTRQISLNRKRERKTHQVLREMKPGVVQCHVARNANTEESTSSPMLWHSD